MSLTAAVWPQFVTQVFRGGIGRLTCIGSDVNKQVTTFTFWAQATTCSKHHTRTVMTQVASVHHGYGRLTLATAGLLFSNLSEARCFRLNFTIVLVGAIGRL